MSTLKTNAIQRTASGWLDYKSDNHSIKDHDAGDAFIVCNHDAAVDIFYDGAKKLETTSTGISITGRIATSAQPAFRATKGGTGFTHSAGTVPYSNEVFDKNNDYDGTDTFTAPVDGVYLFMSSIMVKHGGAGEEHHFQVNGSNANKTQWYSAGGTNTWDNNDMVCILNLSASDTVRVYVNDADLHGGIYMHFSGYLLG